MWRESLLAAMARLECLALVLLLCQCVLSAGILYPPVIQSVLVNGQVDPAVVTGYIKDVVLSCQLDRNTDSSTVTFSWKVNGTSALSIDFVSSNKGATITLPNVKFHPSTYRVGQYNGNYECLANNQKGTARSSPAVLVVGAYAGASDPGYEPTQAVKTFNPGSTVVLQCHGDASVTYMPSVWALGVSYVWFGALPRRALEDSFQRVELKYSANPRFCTNEFGTLYIRSATQDDFSPYVYVSCHILPSIYSPELTGANYNMSASTLGTPTKAPVLIYKSPDLTVAEGSTFTLSCIFDDQGGAVGLISWNNKVDNSKDNGAKVQITSATTDLPPTWTCTYTGVNGATVSGNIKLQVLSYPLVSSVKDTFVFSGTNALFTCTVRGPTPVTIAWFKNDIEVPPTKKYETRPITGFSSSLTIYNVDKTDISVITCAATNSLTTRRQSARLIVTDTPIVTVFAIPDTPVPSSPADFQVSANTTAVRFFCNYTLDPDVSIVTVKWQMGGYSGDIDENTVAPDFGIQRSSVVTAVSLSRSSLTLQYTPESQVNILGTVNCTVLYTILGQTFRAQSANPGRIYNLVVPSAIVITTSAQFPYWIIGVIVAALFLILLVFLIIFCVQRNKGEQYYVDEKERKAGHDPKEELPPWQDFNRPDQDPVKGSRASLEMEGERPMGSDTGSMDEYGVDTETGKFNEDGSFIGQYGPKGQRSGATGHV